MRDVIEIQIEHQPQRDGRGCFEVFANKAHGICQDQAPYHYVQAKGPATLEGTKAHAKREAFKTAYLWQSHATPDCKVTWNFPGAAPRV